MSSNLIKPLGPTQSIRSLVQRTTPSKGYAKALATVPANNNSNLELTQEELTYNPAVANIIIALREEIKKL